LSHKNHSEANGVASSEKETSDFFEINCSIISQEGRTTLVEYLLQIKSVCFERRVGIVKSFCSVACGQKAY